jgi:uncharacterized protein
VPVNESEEDKEASDANETAENEEEADEASLPEAASTGEVLTVAGGVTLASAVAVGYAFSHPDTPLLLGSMGGVYAILAGFTVHRLWRRGELDEQLRPRAGDLSVGFVVAALLWAVALAVHMLVTSPPSPRSAWIMQIYGALGDPASEHRHLIGGVVFLVAALEELVWRGWVMRVLTERMGWFRSWFVQAGLFGLAHTPTLFILSSPVAGPNPLLVAAGIAYSLVWGRLALRFDRLPPALFAHALFTWAVFEFPIWRP